MGMTGSALTAGLNSANALGAGSRMVEEGSTMASSGTSFSRACPAHSTTTYIHTQMHIILYYGLQHVTGKKEQTWRAASKERPSLTPWLV